MSIVELARKLRPFIEVAVQSLSEADALEAVALFPNWKAGQEYTAGQKVQFDGVLYSVLQNHTSQDSWKPADAPSLFAKVLIPDPTVIPEWEQPDSTNAYKKGDTVMYNGKAYRSLIDGNVWSPEAYPAGWEALP
jgi:chitodextrinase